MKRITVSEINDLLARIAAGKSFLGLVDREGWAEFSRMIEEMIRAKQAMLSEWIDDKQTAVLRAEIGLLRWFRRLPTEVSGKLEEWAKRAKALRERVERDHTHGFDRSDPQADEVLKSVRQLQQEVHHG